MPTERFTFTIDSDDYPDIVADLLARTKDRSAHLRAIVVAAYEGREAVVDDAAPDPVADAIQEQTARADAHHGELLQAIYYLAEHLTITAAPPPSSNGHKPAAPESPYRFLTCEECGEAFRIPNEDPDTPYCGTCRVVVGRCADCGQRFERDGNPNARYCDACDAAFMNSAEGRELIGNFGGINFEDV